MTTSSRNRQKGMAALEFGFVVPVLMLLLFGIVEFGVAFYREGVLAGAVREGARAGIIATSPRPTSTQIQQKVQSYLTGIGWDPAPAKVSVAAPCVNPGDSLTVETTYPTSLAVMKKLVPMPGITVDGAGNATLHAKIVMQCE